LKPPINLLKNHPVIQGRRSTHLAMTKRTKRTMRQRLGFQSLSATEIIWNRSSISMGHFLKDDLK